MSAELRVELRSGYLLIEGDGAPRRVAFDATRIERWVERYASLGLDARDEEIQALGNELFEGLAAGEHRWLADALARVDALAFIARDEAPAGRAFLDLPWELLCGPAGWLAAEPFPILRRVLRDEGEETGEVNPSRYRLLVLFMASAPHGTSELDFEGEEARILRATARGRAEGGIDLIVEESGTLDALTRRLAMEDGAVGQVAPDVLHLSCHGGIDESGQPLLMLEDALGSADLVGGSRLAAALADRPPRLIFASASTTASSGHQAPSIARSLVDAGVDAAVGWAGQVFDDSAAEAASRLYAALAEGVTLERAVARARWALLAAQRPDWHRLRLYLGPRGGGAMVRAPDQPSRLATHARLGQPKVFVGRRRVLQAALDALRNGEPVLLHGLAGVGKSALAAKIAERLTGHAVVYTDLQQGAAMLEQRLGARDDAPMPTLLVLDDLERVVDEHGALSPDSAARLAALIEASTGPGAAVKLLMTSRCALPIAAVGIQVPAMTTAELRKLAAVVSPGLSGAMLERTIEAAVGSPAVMRLLLELAAHDTSAWEQMVARLLAWQRGEVDAPASTVADQLQLACLDDLLSSLTVRQREILETLAVFEIPIPSVDALGSKADVEHLIGLGLVEWTEDLAYRHRGVFGSTALVLSPFVRPLVDVPALDVQAAIARRHVELLLHHWSGECPLEIDEELLRIGRLTGHSRAVALGAGSVLAALHQAGRYHTGAGLAREILALLNEARHPPPVLLCWKAAEHLASVGDVERAQALVEEALGSQPDDHELHAGVLWLAGRLSLARGDVRVAEGQLERAAALLDEVGDTYGQAAVFGDLAQLQATLGHVQRAMELTRRRAWLFEQHRDEHARISALEEQAERGLMQHESEAGDDRRVSVQLLENALAFRERFGSTRDRALTVVRVARGRAIEGDLDSAQRMLEDALATFEELEDVHAHAVTRVELARTRAARGDIHGALELHRALAGEFERRGARRDLAIAWGDIARCLLMLGNVEEAERLLHEELVIYDQIGDARARALVLADITRLQDDAGTR